MLAVLRYDPIPIFELGPLNLSLHGLFAGVGFAVGALLMVREARRRGYDAEKVVSVLTWALVGSILGARLFTVPAHITEPGYGIGDVIGVSGDFSILGGYAGGILVGWLRMRMLSLSVVAHLDMAAAGLAIGAVIGRIGDLAIVEHLGGPTSFFLGYQLEPGYDVSPQHDVLERLCRGTYPGIDTPFCGPYHHTALYDMLGALVLLGVVLLLRRAWTTRHYGQLFSIWVIWYGLQRFVIDFARLGVARDGLTVDGRVVEGVIRDSVMGPFTGSQWGGLGAALLGIVLYWWFRRNPVVTEETDRRYAAVPSGAGDGEDAPPEPDSPPPEEAPHPQDPAV